MADRAGLPRAVRGRLADLADVHALPDGAQERLEDLLVLVAEDPTAATSVRDPAQAVDAHVADSLSALALEAVRRGGHIADLGAGAGFPGLPLAIALPGARVTLVESLHRKAGFLERAVEALGLANAAVATDRAETWEAGMGGCDVVTARALAALPVVVEYAAPLLVADGVLVAWKGALDARELADGAAAAEQTGLAAGTIHPVAPFPGADLHHLHMYLKVGTTPNRFPRRPGMARKRPLAAST